MGGVEISHFTKLESTICVIYSPTVGIQPTKASCSLHFVNDHKFRRKGDLARVCKQCNTSLAITDNRSHALRFPNLLESER